MCLYLNVIQPNAFSISLKQIPALRLLDKLHPITRLNYPKIIRRTD